MSAPVPNTCPDIDKIIASIKEAVKALESAKKQLDRESYSDVETYIDYAIRDIEDLCDNSYYRLQNNPLEILRQSNGALREWGESLEKELEQLKNEQL